MFFLCGLPLAAQVLTLDSCKVYALAHNKKLKEARLMVDESEQTKRGAFTNFFPKVSAQAVAMKVNDYLVDVQTPEIDLSVYDGVAANLANATTFAHVPSVGIRTIDYMNMGMVSAIQPLYAGGQIRAGYKLASIGKRINEEALDLSARQVVVVLEEYYWTLVSLEAKQQTLLSYTLLLNNLLADVQVSFDAGLITKTDLLKIKLKINEIEGNHLQLQNAISLTTMALCQHIGVGYSETIVVKDSLYNQVLPSSLYVDPELALARRGEYMMLNLGVDAEVLQKKLALGEIMPQLAVGVQGLYLDMADTKNNYGIAFATLTVPISDWWGGSHKVKSHAVKVNIARNNLDEKSELLKLQMAKAFRQLNESYQQIKVAESLSMEAAEQLKVVNDNYTAGIMSTSDLLEAQAMYQQSQDGLIQAKGTYQIQQVHYNNAVAEAIY